MTNPFANPITAGIINAPVAAPQAQPFAPTPQYAGATNQLQPPAVPTSGGIDDPALFQGFGEPLFPHIDGLFGFEIVGFSVKPARSQGGYTSEASVETTVLVHQSTNAAAPVGSKWRFSYKFGWDDHVPPHTTGGRPGTSTQGPIHAKLLASMLRAATGAPQGVWAAGQVLRGTDFATSERKYYVRMSAELKACLVTDKKTKVQSTQNLRRETWLPAS